MTVLPIPEPGHVGYAVEHATGWIVVDAPLDPEATRAGLPAAPRAAVETGIPHHRIGGGRILAAALDIPLYGPDGIAGALPLEELKAAGISVGGAGVHRTVAVASEVVLIGDLDTIAWAPDAAAAGAVTAARRAVATAHPHARLLGSAGEVDAARLAGLDQPATGPAPLNADAIALTNRGRADMFWADPRTAEAVPETSLEEVRPRLDSPWGPVILDLRDPPTAPGPARHLAPRRVASELTGLTTERQIVVVADDDELARRTAGFLAGLGLSALWARN